MPIDDLRQLSNQLTLPVIGAPMFIAGSVDLVVAQCRAGIVGAFPARTTVCIPPLKAPDILFRKSGERLWRRSC